MFQKNNVHTDITWWEGKVVNQDIPCRKWHHLHLSWCVSKSLKSEKKNCSKNELSLKLWNNYEINNFNKIFYWAIMSSVKHWQGSYYFTLFKFHDFPWLFHDLIKFSMTSGLETVPKTKTLVSTKKHAVHASLYLVLALSSRVTNLPNKTLNFQTFQAWEMRFLNSMTFQIFHYLYDADSFQRILHVDEHWWQI